MLGPLVLPSLATLQVARSTWAESPEGRRYTAFDRALAVRDFGTASRLLAQGVDVDRPVSHGETRLMIVCCDGNLEVVRFLVRRGAGLERTTWRGGLTPLAFAANGGRASVVALLLKIGANPDGANGGYRPLQGAAAYGYRKVARMLLRAGAHVDATDSRGTTPLMQAAWGDQASMVRLLLGAGATPRLKDKSGETAFDMAREKQFNDIERLLRLSNG